MTGNSAPDGMAAAISRIPSGLAILTASHRERSTGMLASWIQQASFHPLMVTVCVKKGRPIQPLIDGSEKFVLNIMGEDQPDMLKHFAKGFAAEEHAFQDLDVCMCAAGVELSAAIAHLACRVVTKMPAGDHCVYLGEAISGEADRDARPYVHLRKTALSY